MFTPFHTSGFLLADEGSHHAGNHELQPESVYDVLEN